MKELYSSLNQLNYFSTKQLTALGFSYGRSGLWLVREIAKGNIYRIKPGLFITHEKKQELIHTKLRGHRSYYMACNVIYPGSIISHETVLALHQAIPEMITSITCVTHKKTNKVITPRSSYSYRHLTDRYWRGFESKIVDGMMYSAATVEKALFDWLWWRDDIVRETSRFEELRLEFDVLDYTTFKNHVRRSQSPKMEKVLFFLTPLRGY